jgi:hypothetical protein
MTTLEPGASVVLTHGLLESPRSTAFLATSAAPIITDGFDVLVHDVIAAMTTAPWSTSLSVPSARVTFATLRWRSTSPRSGAPCGCPAAPFALVPTAIGSLAGNDSADPLSTREAMPSPSDWVT